MKRTLIICISAVLFGAAAVGAAQAAKVKVWHHSVPSHHDKAQLKNAVVSSEGTIRLSKLLRPLPGVEAAHVWDVVEDRAGNLYAATGDEGKVFKVTPDGKATVAFTSEDSQVFCLAAASDGSVYAGTGPGGHVVRLSGNGAAKVVADLEDGYVWALAVDAKGENIYAATGPRGRIYRLGPDGKASVFYQTKHEHVLCLALGADGNLYAGTDKGGLVYRIDPRGKGFVAFSAPQSEVRSLAVAADGSVYAGTSSPTKRRGPAATTAGTSGGSGSALSGPSAAPLAGNRPKETPAAEGPSKTASSDSKEPTKGSPAAAPSVPGGGDNSLFRIAADGTVRELFREKAMVLRLLRHGGKVLVGTGMDGQLFEADERTRERTELIRLDHGQILSLLRRGDGSVVIGTGDPGRLYVLQDRCAARGTITSEVLDAKLVSKWGALRWKAEAPAKTAVTLAVRSGNTSEPDDTWSDWSAEQTDSQQAVAAAPAARFLQYRVTMTSDNPAATPTLSSVTVRYQGGNQAPEVTKVEVPDLDAGNLDEPKRLKLRWAATDANEDELTFDLYIRKDGWKNWVLLEEELTKTEYEWDTTTTPSGVYEVKVVASDRRDNSDEDALTGQRASVSFVVSHALPVVSVKVAGVEGEQAVVEATVTDAAARLTAASYSLNGRKWVSVFPTDGLFDDRSEKFRFKTEALKPGTYVLVLRVKDAAGNTGTADVVFTVETKPAPR